MQNDRRLSSSPRDEALDDLMRRQERHFRLLVRSVSDCAIYMLDVDGIVSNWNAGAQRTKGYLADEIVGRHFSCFYTMEDRATRLPERGLNIARETGKFEAEGWRLRKDGSRFWAHVVIDAIYDDDGLLCGYAKVTRDRTEQRDADASVELARRNLDLALSQIQQGVCLIDPAGRIVLCNARFPGLLNLPDGDVRQGTRALRVLRELDRGDTAEFPLAQGPSNGLGGFGAALQVGSAPTRGPRRLRLMSRRLLALARNGAHTSREDVARIGAPKTAAVVPLEWRYRGRHLLIALRTMPTAPGAMPSSGGWLCTIEDVTAQRAAQDHISYLAHHDTLTGLPNRTRFYAHMHALAPPPMSALGAEVRAVAPRFSLLYLDLDNFKPVNDSYGHHVGDCLLKAVSERLRALLDDNDVLTRLGGDEFAIIQAPRFGADCHENEAHTTDLAQRCLDALMSPFHIGDHRLQVGVSIGIVISDALQPQADGPIDLADSTALVTSQVGRFALDSKAGLMLHDPDAVLRFADIALYQAKRHGRNCFRVYRPGMQDPLAVRRELERHLQHAVNEGHFTLSYQPLVDAVSGRLNACEALLRWDAYPSGAITPSEFIPVAEEIGLMQRLGSWVLERACEDAMYWPDDIRVCVNVSPVQLQDSHFAEFVQGVLARTRLPPRRLEIELTETALITHTSNAVTILSALRELGVGVVMDDFGTGYSALSLLQTLPFSRIKIDQLFVRSLGENSKANTIVRAVTRLCSDLGIAAVGEGVETDAQRRLLAIEGCTELQGFLFSEPVALPELRSMLGIDERGLRRAWPGADPRLLDVVADAT
ncbi:EAL domain-containing protein [Robbsia sp. KACC 23696]|uniref:sensor domain-containing protein n=1 Tax=Robbsia sp. KACC 23696 TaxID=3149231 RepID=UPI00325A61FE